MTTNQELWQRLNRVQRELQSTDSELVEGVYEELEAVLAKLRTYAEKLVAIRESLHHWDPHGTNDQLLIRAGELQEEAEAHAPTPADLTAGERSLEYWIQDQLLDTFVQVEDELLAYRAHADQEKQEHIDELISTVEHLAEEWDELCAYVASCKPALREIDIVQAAQADRPLDDLETQAARNIERVDDLIETLHPQRLGRLFAKVDLGVLVDAPAPAEYM